MYKILQSVAVLIELVYYWFSESEVGISTLERANPISIHTTPRKRKPLLSAVEHPPSGTLVWYLGAPKYFFCPPPLWCLSWTSLVEYPDHSFCCQRLVRLNLCYESRDKECEILSCSNPSDGQLRVFLSAYFPMAKTCCSERSVGGTDKLWNHRSALVKAKAVSVTTISHGQQ